MSTGATLSRDERGLRLEGALDFDSVPALLREGERLLMGPGTLAVDLGGVREANSAALALLLEWLDLARRRKVALRFRNLPDSLVRLAALSNVSGLLQVPGGRAAPRDRAEGAQSLSPGEDPGEGNGHGGRAEDFSGRRGRHDR